MSNEVKSPEQIVTVSYNAPTGDCESWEAGECDWEGKIVVSIDTSAVTPTAAADFLRRFADLCERRWEDLKARPEACVNALCQLTADIAKTL